MSGTDIFIVALGSTGDVLPFVGLGSELSRRGHGVTMLANGHFRNMIEGAGLVFEERGTAEEYLNSVNNPALWDPKRSFAYLAETAFLANLEPVYEHISEHYIAGRMAVVHSVMAFGARLAQEKLGVPTVTVNLSPAVLRSVWRHSLMAGWSMPQGMPRLYKHGVYRLIDHLIVDKVLTKPLNVHRARLGLSPIDHILDGWLSSPELSVCLWPDWFAPIQPDWPKSIKLTGFPLNNTADISDLEPDVTAFLDAGPAPIVFTFGTAMTRGDDLFAASANLCRKLGRRGVLLTQYPDQLPPDLPDTIRHFDFVPLNLLLKRAAAIVHMGGIGTMAQGLAAGVPQLIVPIAVDQPDNASRLEELGAGRSISVTDYCRGLGAAPLAELLEDTGTAEKCMRLATQCDGPASIGAACDAIEALI